MKGFLGGLALATVMALLSGASTPSPSVCIVFPRFETAQAVEVPDSCRTACAVRATP